MPAKKNRVQLQGSERAKVAGARLVGDVKDKERIEVTVRIRPRSSGVASAAALSAQSIDQRRYLTRDELQAAQGADPEDVAKVESFAYEHGLDVTETDLAQRKVVLAGTAENVSAAFDVKLKRYRYTGGTFRGRSGPLMVPSEIASIIEGVFGLDDRPQARPHFRRLRGGTRAKKGPMALAASRAAVAPQATASAFTPTQLARLYNFPANLDGKGQCIAIIELGGGFRGSDLTAYFGQLGVPLPKITAVSVDGGRNNPTNANSADGEVMLDIEVAGAVAPGAEIVVYFAPNTDRGFLDAITAAVHDTVHNPSVISISWGAAEIDWTAQAMQAMDQAFQDASAVGVTVFCASGDNGSGDGVGDNLAHADFPASSPFAVGCGGTRVSASTTSLTDERTWNDGAQGGATGGGISDFFDRPSYQAAAQVPKSANPGGRVGRGVPDMSGDASPASGYIVRVDGQDLVIGGTSAVAPLLAGLTALINQQLGKPVGFMNPLLYEAAAAAGAFHDVTSGDNGAYQSRPGWDACTGLGRPDGTDLLQALGGLPSQAVRNVGTLEIPAGMSSATQAGVRLRSSSVILATLAGDDGGNDIPGLWVREAIPNPAGASFEVFLNDVVPTDTSAKVAWIIRSA